MWWHSAIIIALEKVRQKDQEFRSSRPTLTTQSLRGLPGLQKICLLKNIPFGDGITKYIDKLKYIHIVG